MKTDVWSTRGDRREAGHRVVDVEVLGKATVLEIGELPSAEHSAALAGIAALAVVTRIARRDRADRHSLANLKQTAGSRDFAQFMDDSHCFVPERQALRSPIAPATV